MCLLDVCAQDVSERPVVQVEVRQVGERALDVVLEVLEARVRVVAALLLQLSVVAKVVLFSLEGA